MTISALPTPPSRAASPDNFAAQADALLGALPAFVTEANALQADVNAKQVTASTAATTAITQAGIATTKAGEASVDAADADAARIAAESARDLAAGYRDSAAFSSGQAAASALTASNAAGTCASLVAGIADGPVTSVNGKTGIVTLAPADIAAAASQAEMEAGTEADIRSMSPLRVKQAIDVLAGSKRIRSARAANTILGTADKGALIDITSGTFTQTFAACSTLGNGWWCYIRNSGTGDIMLDPNASETIDSLTSFIMYPGETRLLLCDGTALRSVVLNTFYRAITTSGSFKKPPGYAGFEVEVIGGGAGGPGGEPSTINGSGFLTRTGQAGGAAGLRRAPVFFASGELEDSSTVVVGAGGSGGAPNASGGAGGASYFISPQDLSSGSAGVAEISGIRRCGTSGGSGGNTALHFNSATGSNGGNGRFNVTGVTLPQGGVAANVGNNLQSGTYTATAGNGQSANVPFCSGAGGGSAGGGASTNLYGAQLIITLKGGNGGHGGLGAGGGAGGDAVVVWGSPDLISWENYPAFTVTGGTGGNGGPGLVSVWGVI